MATYYSVSKLICIAGLPGAGKSTVSDIFVGKGFSYVRFGQIVIDEVLKRKLEINEKNERLVREELRAKYGMAVMAKLNLNKLRKMLKNGDSVVADGLYSFAEYKLLKKEFGKNFVVIAIHAPPETRYKRLIERKEDKNDKNIRFRKLTRSEAIARDYAEIEHLDKAGPIAMADFTILNTGTRRQLATQVKKLISIVTGSNVSPKNYLPLL